MTGDTQEPLTPAESIAAEIREHDRGRSYHIEEARKGALWAGGMGGLAVWAALSGDSSLFAGVDAAVALWNGIDVVTELACARNASREATALRQTLAQHSLATGEVVTIYEDETTEEEQAHQARLFDHERPSEA